MLSFEVLNKLLFIVNSIYLCIFYFELNICKMNICYVRGLFH